jgi:beta-glucosidase
MKRIISAIFIITFTFMQLASQNRMFTPYQSPIGYDKATQIADGILKKLTLEEKVSLLGGKKLFYIKGFPEKNLPELYLADATQGVNIRKYVSNQLKKSTAFPAPILLASTWNPELSRSTQGALESNAGLVGWPSCLARV